MSALAQAIHNAPDARTANGAETYSTSKNPIVDLFFVIGGASLKNVSVASLVTMFEEAYVFDSERAIRILLWLRDIRGGAGRREIFRQVMKHLEKNRTDLAAELVQFAPEYGRWDDILIFENQSVKEAAYAAYARALSERNGLAAKWAPRKGIVAKELREFLGLTPKQYRKLVVGLTNVVETQMCSNDWNAINFSHVPSVASLRYAKAFNRHDQERYTNWRNGLVKGETKVNTGALYPHDVVVSLRTGDATLANGVWSQMPDFTGDASIMAVVDVSSSMTSPVQGNVTAMDISVALGMYLAQKNRGPFKDLFMTFSGSPTFVRMNPNASLQTNYNTAMRSPVGYDTNLQRAVELLLRTAVQNKASAADMPQMLLFISDMAYNSCNRGGTNLDNIRMQYQEAGYKLPAITFWNVNGVTGNIPVRYDESGVALVSGFSPAILKSVLAAKDFTPQSVVDATIMGPRYTLPFMQNA